MSNTIAYHSLPSETCIDTMTQT